MMVLVPQGLQPFLDNVLELDARRDEVIDLDETRSQCFENLLHILVREAARSRDDLLAEKYFLRWERRMSQCRPYEAEC